VRETYCQPSSDQWLAIRVSSLPFLEVEEIASPLLGSRLGPCLPIAYCQNIQVVEHQKAAGARDSLKIPMTSIPIVSMAMS